MNVKQILFGLTSLSLAAAFAAEENELTPVETRGRWTVRAGYAWRSKAKTDFSAGQSQAPGGRYWNGSVWGDVSDSQVWSHDGAFDTGRYTEPNYGCPLYSMGLERDESVGGGSGEDSAHGFNLFAGYDVWQSTYADVSVLAMFAGYWNMRNSCWGGYRRYADHYEFNTPLPEDIGLQPEPGYSTARFRDREYGIGGANPTMRLKADLYQIGLGPQVVLHPFENWCSWMDWLDVYGNVLVLCNIIHSDFDAGAASTSDTSCRIGFGGNVGLVGNITDWCGIYGQIGYEWIDKDGHDVRGCRAETDYSSLVLSAGVQFRF